MSGRIDEPVLDANAVLIRDGIIDQVGQIDQIQTGKPDTVIDCRETTVIPGLIDTHCHPVFGDYTPKQNQIGFLDSMLHGGVTTAISAGEVHLPGRPTDPAGVKALAILAAKSYANFRPGGIKVEGGALILEKGLVEADFIGNEPGRGPPGGRNRFGLGQDHRRRRTDGAVGQGQRHEGDDAYGRHFDARQSRPSAPKW